MACAFGALAMEPDPPVIDPPERDPLEPRLINDRPLWCVSVTYKDWYQQDGKGKKIWYEWVEDPFYVRATTKQRAIDTIETLAAFAGELVVSVRIAMVGGNSVEEVQRLVAVKHQPWCSSWSPCHEGDAERDDLPW